MNIVDACIAELHDCGCEDCEALAQQLFENQHNAQRYLAVREFNAGIAAKPRDAEFYSVFDKKADELLVYYQQEGVRH